MHRSEADTSLATREQINACHTLQQPIELPGSEFHFEFDSWPLAGLRFFTLTSMLPSSTCFFPPRKSSMTWIPTSKLRSCEVKFVNKL